MREVKGHPGSVVVPCVCGGEVILDPQQLGKVLACPHCSRYMRSGLRFFLMDQRQAPNLTVQCECGHFVVRAVTDAGKRATCSVCKRQMIMPQPVIRFDTSGKVRLSRKALDAQRRRTFRRKKRPSAEMTRLESAAHRGRITLRPGEHICVNEGCGALLAASANVCPKCGTNRVTGQAYDSAGPDADPRPKWREV